MRSNSMDFKLSHYGIATKRAYTFCDFLDIEANIRLDLPIGKKKETGSDLIILKVPRVFFKKVLQNDFLSKRLIYLGDATYGIPNGEFLYYKPSFHGITFHILLANLSRRGSIFLMSNLAWQVGRFLFPSLQNATPRALIYDNLLFIKSFQKGFVLIHGALISSVEFGGILISGFSDIGKTTTSQILARKGFVILDDDTIALDKNGFCIGRRRVKRIRPRILYLLERGPTSCHELSKDEALRKLFSICVENYLYSCKIFHHYAHLNDCIDIQLIYDTWKAYIKNLVNTIPCYTIRAKEPHKFADIITEMSYRVG